MDSMKENYYIVKPLSNHSFFRSMVVTYEYI